MKHLLLLLFLPLLLATSASAQTLLETTVEPRPGQCILDVRGIFRGSDTVLVQVYHDSDVLAEEVRIYNWAITLMDNAYYVIKFTDEQDRVKYLYILELSDDQIEFIPPIEVDFNVAGNLVLIKPRDRQPDFMLFDVGMSRNR